MSRVHSGQFGQRWVKSRRQHTNDDADGRQMIRIPLHSNAIFQSYSCFVNTNWTAREKWYLKRNADLMLLGTGDRDYFTRNQPSISLLNFSQLINAEEEEKDEHSIELYHENSIMFYRYIYKSNSCFRNDFNNNIYSIDALCLHRIRAALRALCCCCF